LRKGHLSLFGVLGGKFAELFAAIFGQRRNVDPDDLAVVVGREPRSLMAMAFSIRAIEPLSNGWIWMVWESGVKV